MNKQPPKVPFYKNFTCIIFSGFLFFVVEYLIKNFVVSNVTEKAVMVDNLFSIQFVPNHNMAFSIPVNQAVIIVFASIILLFFLNYFTICVRDGLYGNIWAANLVIWGALSNLYDRISRGFVVDYVHLGILPVFNLSDLAVLGGLIALLYFIDQKDRLAIYQLKEA